MKKQIFTIVGYLYLSGALAQDQQSNLEKYWRYRERLRQNFIVINEQVESFGVNLPASAVNFDSGHVEWGDGNNGISHYLSVLATELWLLKNNEQDYSATLKELYYAMLAIERLDLYSEYSLRVKNNLNAFVNPATDINGFHIRDDISEEFWNEHSSHFNVPEAKSNYKDNGMEEISQDNIYHNFEGLALVSKLVGTESVINIPVSFVYSYIPDYLSKQRIMDGTSVNFSLWAKDIVKRYIKFMQSDKISYAKIFFNHWVLKNPVTHQLVREGSGKDFDTGLFYNVGVISTGKEITGQNLRKESPFILNDLEAELLFLKLFNTGGNVPIIYIPMPPPFNLIVEPITLLSADFDRYKITTLASMGNIAGPLTFYRLQEDRGQHPDQPYEHFPLFYTVLHDPNRLLMHPENNVYNRDRVLLENLLNAAPYCGPSSNGNYYWSSDSRCVWPERLGSKSNENIEYSGLDYMMLHNLFYIAFRAEDFKNTVLENNANNNSNYANGSFLFTALEASNEVPVSGKVTYNARKSIKLKPGFIATKGATFHAQIIGPRPNNYAGFLYKSLSVSQCRKSADDSSGGKSTTTHIPPTFSNEIYRVKNYKQAGKPVIDHPIEAVYSDKIDSAFQQDEILMCYPNPTNSNLNISFAYSQEETVPIEIINTNGKIVLSTETKSPNFIINLSPLPNGIYLLKTYFRKQLITKRFILIR